MAKETEGQENQNNGDQEQEQNNDLQFSQSLESTLDALSGLTDVGAIVKQLENQNQQPADDEKNKEPKKQPAASSKTDTNKSEEDEENKEEDEEDEKPELDANGKPIVKKQEEQTPPAPEGKKSKLGISLPGQKKGNETIIEKPEQILGIINSKFGMDLKEVKDLPKFIETTLKFRADAQKLKSTQTELEELQQSISSLPLEFTEAINAFAAGEDYTVPFKQKSPLNFSVTSEKQDIKTLVNHYFKDKFTDEDFKEETPSEKLEIAIIASKDKFNSEKQAYDGKRASIADNAKRSLQVFNASVEGSVNQLKQDFPDTDDATIKEVELMFKGGPQGVISLFFNKDGTLKPEAAKLAYMAKYGEEEIQIMIDTASRQGETKMNEELLTRSADTRKPSKKNNGANNMISEETKKRLAELSEVSGKKKNTY